MRIRPLFITLALLFSLAGNVFFAQPASALSFDAGSIMPDSSFDFNQSSWSAAQIDNWLNANFPSGCISGSFRTPDPQGYSSAQGKYLFGGNVTAGTAIYHAAQNYSVDPRVILAMLQKEQSIVTGSAGCHYNTPNPATATSMTDKCGSGTRQCTLACTYSGGCMNIAMSMGCPNYCSVKYNGFSMQLISGTWLLKFAEQRAYGRTTGYPGYDEGDEYYGYGGVLVPPAGDGHYHTQDGYDVVVKNGASASLYYYNPLRNPNERYYNIYTGWFGDPDTPCHGTANISATPSGRRIISYQYRDSDPTTLMFTQQNNTGSKCTEAHVWNSGYTSWSAHYATGMKTSIPVGGTLVAMDTPYTRRDSLAYIKYSGGGGKLEIHKFSPNTQIFPGYYDVATNLTGVTANSGTFVAGDFLKRGYDQLAYVLYNGSSAHTEVHLFDPTLQKAIGYYDVATNLTGVTANSGTFVAGDFLKRGYDQLAYVLYNGSSAHTEVHLFDPTLQKAIGYYDVATNLTGVTANSGTFVAGDFLKRGYDQLAYVLYNGSSGKSEVHTFTPDLTKATGYQDIATNLRGFDPTQ